MTTTTGGDRLGYMPGIDGLRAVSVLLVLVFHADLGWLPGGFVGVSVFFTLSGFLITTLLVVDLERTGRVSLAAFWGRRFRRLAPAALLTVAAVVVWGRLGGPIGPGLRADALSAVANVANWRFALAERDYADLFAGPSPLLHLWSLAIEEQFYLLLPVLVIVGWRCGLRRRGLVVGFVSAGLLSLLAAVLTDSAALAYYGTHTRMVELFTGCALGAALGGRLTDLARGVVRGAVAAGAVGLVVLVAVARHGSPDSATLVHGGLGALSLASAAAVLAVAVPGPLAGVLGWWPLRQLGRISYGVYLFHWPVFVGFRAGGHTGVVAMGLATLVTVALAAVSFVLVEMPIRTRRLLPGRAGAAAYPAALCAVAAIAALIAPVDASSRLDFVLADSPTPVSFTQPSTSTTSAMPTAQGEPASTAAATEPRLPRLLVIGDSTGVSLQTGLSKAAAGTFDVVGASYIACPLVAAVALRPSPGVELDSTICPDADTDLAALLDEYEIDLVLGVYSLTEQVPQRYAGDSQWYAAGSDGYRAHHEREIVRLLAVLREHDVPLALLDSPYLRPGDDEDGHLPEQVDAWNAVIRGWDATYDDVYRIDYARWFPEPGSDADREARPDSLHPTVAFTQQLAGDHLLAAVSAVLDDWSARSALSARSARSDG